MWYKIFAGVHFCESTIFYIVRKLTFAILKTGFSCWVLIFAVFGRSRFIEIKTFGVFEFSRMQLASGSGGSRGRVRGIRTPLSDLTFTTFRLKSLHQQDRISLFNWLIFLMKRPWHFSTKLNSRDIQICNCSWVPSYDLFASARKAVFTSRIQVNGMQPRIYNVQPRLVGGVVGGMGEK